MQDFHTDAIRVNTQASEIDIDSPTSKVVNVVKSLTRLVEDLTRELAVRDRERELFEAVNNKK